MTIKIAENIRNLRKERALTQEQLAEVLGVTAGAVYKWEVGLSFPEIRMLIEIADLFEISVDALLGYEQQNSSVETIVNRIEKYRSERKFCDAVTEVEKALKKYPNNFKLTYQGALTYQVIFIEEKDKNAAEKSIALYTQAIAFLYQNTDSNVSEAMIWNKIAQNHIMLGETEQALQILKDKNVCGINNALIGSLYASVLHQPNEAKQYLVQAFAENLRQTLLTMAGFIDVYKEMNNNDKFKETLLWLCGLLESIKEKSNSITFADRYIAVFTAICGLIEANNKDYNKAEENIYKAYLLAKQFDATPIYGVQGIKFFDGAEENAVIFDDLSKSAIGAIENIIYSEREESEAYRYVRNIWTKIKEREVKC